MSRPRVFTEDLYAVLGVARGADDEAIRRAGRARQRATHPDYGGDAAEFVRVRIAVEVLGDPELRAQHDEWLAGSRSRRGGGRLRSQQRASRRREARRPAPAPTARAPRPQPEAPPPSRIPKPLVDLRRMAWARTNWPAEATQWPPATAVLPPLTLRQTVLVGLLALLLVGGAVLFWADWSPARFEALTVPPVADAPTLWAPIVLYLLLSAAWLVPAILVRMRIVSRILNIVAAVVAVLFGASAVVTAIFVGSVDGFPAAVGSLVQAVVSLATGVMTLVTWSSLAPRARAFLQESLLVRLADGSAPPVGDPMRVFGSAAQSTMGGAGGVSAGVNPMRAVMAQRIVGDALGDLLRIPGVRIVHGLRAPGGGPGVVAHAVVAGRRIAFIDDELWAPGTYGIGRDGGLRRDGEPYPTSATEFPHAVEAFHRLFGEVALVRGWITIVPEREGALEIDNALTWERARLASVESMLREVGDWVAQDGTRVDRLLLRDLLRHRA